MAGNQVDAKVLQRWGSGAVGNDVLPTDPATLTGPYVQMATVLYPYWTPPNGG